MAKKRLTRVVVLLIAVSMIMSLFVGCGSKDVEPTTTTAEDTAKPEREYVIRISTTEAGIPNNNKVVDKLSEMLGVKIVMDVLPRGAEGTSKLNLLLAANDFPDIINDSIDLKIFDNGLAKFTMDELEANMPKYLEYMNENAGPAAEVMWKAKYVDSSNNMKALSTINPNSMIPYGGVWRMDMLEEAGVTSVPTTIEEFGNALAKVKAKWPKNYPMTGRGAYLWQCFTTIFGAYGVVPFNWGIYDDGKPMPGMLSKNAKYAFKTLNEWFQKGYIDPEYVTLKDTPNMSTGNTVFCEWAGWGYYNDNLPTATPYQEAKKVNPNAKFAMTPLIKSELYPDVKPTWPVWDPIDYGHGTTGFGIQLEKDRDKLIKCLQIEERLLFDKEVALVAAYGIEGEHWTRNSDGSVAISPDFPLYSEVAINAGVHAQVYAGMGGGLSVAASLLKGDIYFQEKEKYMNLMGVTMQNWRDFLSISIQKGSFKDAAGEEIKVPNLYKLQDQAFVWLISGEKPFSWFDEFASQWMKAGGDKLTEAALRDFMPK